MRTRKYFLVYIVIISFVHNSPISFAEESEMPAVAPPPVTELVPHSQGEYARKTLNMRKQDRIMNLGGNIRNRIHAVVSRFDGIAVRLESRMNKLEQEGYDTIQSRKLITQAYAQQEVTRGHLTKLDTLPTLISSDTPRASFEIIREEFIHAKDSLRQTQSILWLTVQEMKSITEKSKPLSATTTGEEN